MPYDVYPRVQASISSASLIPDQLAAGGGDVTGMKCIRTAFAASGQDVTVFPTAGAPVKLRLLDVFMDVTTANASETLTIRDASGGGGNALSSALSVGAT